MAKKKNSGRGSIRKLKKSLRRAGHSLKLRRQVVRTAKGYARSRKLVKAERGNPPKMKRVTGSTGWMRADAVRVVRRRGKLELLIKRRKKGARRK